MTPRQRRAWIVFVVGLCASVLFTLVFDDTNPSTTGLTRFYSLGREGLDRMFAFSAVWSAAGLGFQYLLVMVFGFSSLRLMLSSAKEPVPESLMWGAGFLFGYLGFVATMRMLTLLLPMSVGIPLGYVLLTILTGLLFWVLPYRPNMREAILAAACFALLLLVCLVQQVQNGMHFLVGDATGDSVNFLKAQLEAPDPSGRLPFVFFHYDEVLFNFPLFFMGWHTKVVEAMFWLLNGFGKASSFFAALVVLHLLGVRGLLLWLGGVFVFLGTPSLNPQHYLLLFDSDNPLFFVVHLGRAISALLPLGLLLICLHVRELRRGPIRPLAILVIGLLGLGLAGTSMHNFAYFVAFASLTAVHTITDWRHLKGALLIVAGVVALVVITYATRPLVEPEGTRGSLLLLGLFLPLAWLIPRRRTVLKDEVKSLKPLWVALASGLFAFLLLGNVFSGIGRKTMVPVADAVGFELPGVWKRNVSFEGGSLKMFEWVGCFGPNQPKPESPLKHCVSNASFVGTFGVFMVMLVAGIMLSLKLHASLWVGMLILNAGLFSGALFVKDFMITGTWDWFMSRFLEGPYYVVIFLFIAAFNRSSNALERRLLGGWLMMWSVLPYVSMGLWKQWLENWAFLFP